METGAQCLELCGKADKIAVHDGRGVLLIDRAPAVLDQTKLEEVKIK